MTSFITKAALAPVAATFALAIMMAAPASAQSSLTNGPDGMQPNTLGKSKPHAMRRPLTVRRAMAAPVVVAPARGPVAGVVGGASTVVALPFQVLGGIFPDGGPRKGGVTPVRYMGTGAKAAEVDEGWTMAVPVDRSGPIFVVENGDPTISPLSFVGAPIRAIGTVAQTPLKVLAAPF